MIAIVQVLCIQGHSTRESHLLVDGSLEAAANLTHRIHLSADSGVVSHVGTHTHSHSRHSVIGIELAKSGEAGVLVEFIVHGHIELLEEVVASAAHQHIVVAVGEGHISGHGTGAGAGGLQTEHGVLILR